MHTTSPSLLMRLRQPGDPEAWTRFVRLYSPMLYQWACDMRLQHADAVDLVQDVFATLVTKLPEFAYDSQQRFRGWLWTVTRNKWRERQRRKRLPLDGGACVEMLPSAADDPGEALAEEDFRRRLLEHVCRSMPENFQPLTWRAFWAHVVEARPAPEVAAQLGMTPAAVYKSKVRVLAKLHKEMADLLAT